MIETRITIQANFDLTDDIGQVINDLTEQMPKSFRALTDESVPTGRLYKRGRIRGRFLKGLQRVPGTKTRAFVGQKFHRASAKGQIPAKDSGELYKKVRVSGGKLNKKVIFAAPHAGHVEEIRPFVVLTVERAVKDLPVFNDL